MVVVVGRRGNHARSGGRGGRVWILIRLVEEAWGKRGRVDMFNIEVGVCCCVVYGIPVPA